MFRGFLFVLLATPLFGQAFNDYDLKPHDYFGATLKDPMSVLLGRLGEAETAMDEENGKPLVRRLLKELEVPEESQILVFTKTSLQRRVVNSGNPRALYFNEDVYVGWMPNGRIEVTSVDPELGGIFYFQRPLDAKDQPLFHREESCLGCHAGSATNFLPGLLARSVFPDADGNSLKSVNSFERIGHHVPFEERWGGWFVTGEVGTAKHMGNALARGERRSEVSLLAAQPVDAFFPQDLHLRPGSDVLAMLLHDHQISMQQWMLEAHYRVRQGLFDAKVGDESRGSLDAIESEDREDIDKCVDGLLRYLFFANEAAMGDVAWKDGGEYREVFLKNRRRDSKGRSLKDVRLDGRLFDYRCSYMIYSKSFAALPRSLKEEIYHRMDQILSSEVAGFEHLDAAEKVAIREILVETLPEAASYWRGIAAG